MFFSLMAMAFEYCYTVTKAVYEECRRIGRPRPRRDACAWEPATVRGVLRQVLICSFSNTANLSHTRDFLEIPVPCGL